MTKILKRVILKCLNSNYEFLETNEKLENLRKQL